MQYEDLLKRLRSIEPVHGNPSMLTDQIVSKILAKETMHNFFFLKSNQRQWHVFSRIRILVASAAVFLLVFFLYQQWDINQKLQKLEEQVSLNGLQNHESQFSQVKSINTHFIDEALTYEADSTDEGVLMINRKTLNFLRKTIEELEKENLSIREKLLRYNTDSTLIIK